MREELRCVPLPMSSRRLLPERGCSATGNQARTSGICQSSSFQVPRVASHRVVRFVPFLSLVVTPMAESSHLQRKWNTCGTTMRRLRRTSSSWVLNCSRPMPTTSWSTSTSSLPPTTPIVRPAYLTLIRSNADLLRGTDARALFERTAALVEPVKAKPIWDRMAEFEYRYGDFLAAQKIYTRYSETFPDGSSSFRSFWLPVLT